MIGAVGIRSKAFWTDRASRRSLRRRDHSARGDSSAARYATPLPQDPKPAQMQNQHLPAVEVDRRRMSTSGIFSGPGIESSSGSSPHEGESRNSSPRSAFSCTSGWILLPRSRASSPQVTGSYNDRRRGDRRGGGSSRTPRTRSGTISPTSTPSPEARGGRRRSSIHSVGETSVSNVRPSGTCSGISMTETIRAVSGDPDRRGRGSDARAPTVGDTSVMLDLGRQPFVPRRRIAYR